MNALSLLSSARFLSLVVEVAQERSQPDPQTLREELRAALGELVEALSRRGASRPSVAHCNLALVAFADEALLSAAWPGRGRWLRQPMQLELFGDFAAGERCARHLASLGGGAGCASLPVYWAVIALGFRGDARLGEPAEAPRRLERLFRVPAVAGEAAASGARGLRPVSLVAVPLVCGLLIGALLAAWAHVEAALVLGPFEALAARAQPLPGARSAPRPSLVGRAAVRSSTHPELVWPG